MRDSDREIERETQIETETQRETETGRETETQTDRDRQTVRQTETNDRPMAQGYLKTYKTIINHTVESLVIWNTGRQIIGKNLAQRQRESVYK